MDQKKILREIRLLRVHLDKLQSEAESINIALMVLEKELSDSGMSGSSSPKSKKAQHREEVVAQALAKYRARKQKRRNK